MAAEGTDAAAKVMAMTVGVAVAVAMVVAMVMGAGVGGATACAIPPALVVPEGCAGGAPRGGGAQEGREGGGGLAVSPVPVPGTGHHKIL